MLNLQALTPEALASLSDDEYRDLLAEFVQISQEDRKQNQLLYYKPASPKVQLVHNSAAKVVGIGGGNGCQVAGTRVITGRGMIPIEEVVIGDAVPGRHKHHGRVTSLYRSPKKVPCYRITTKRGYTMIASGDHLNLVASERRRDWHNASDADWKTSEWVRLDDLANLYRQEQLYIHMSTGGGFPDQSELTEDDAFFLGLMVGDGHYAAKQNRKNAMNYTTNDNDIVLISWMKNYLNKRGVYCSVSHKNQANGTDVKWCNAKFAMWMDSVGVKRCLGPEKTIPESVWRGTERVVASFIRGLADSDGCATTKPSVVFINRSTELIRGIHILLRRFGINASLRFTESDGHVKRPNGIWRLEVCGANLRRYAKWIGFLSPQKAARLPKASTTKKAQTQARWDRIASVDRVEDQIVYGLTISPKPHYQADGFLQHNSSKTESALVEMVMCATGVFPYSQRHLVKQKFRGPIQCRLVVESLTTTLEPIILPKLMWWKWTGVDAQGGERGHWGWIPKHCLIDGEWDRSWSARLRVLRVLCRDPENPDRVLGESSIQCLRGDQRVLMADGVWREIVEIKIGDRVADGRGGITKVLKTYNLPKAPLFRIRTTRGMEIIATQNHVHFMQDGSERRTDQLTIKDRLLIQTPTLLKGQHSFEKWQLGWMAIMLGDGCIKFKQARFTAIAPSRVLNDLPPLPPGCHLHDHANGKDWTISTGRIGRRSNPLIDLLKKHHLWGLGSKEKHVPDAIFRECGENIAYFLRHLWNCDGCILRKGRQALYATISRKFAYDVKYLLWSIGVYACVVEKTARCGFTGKIINSFQVTISGGSFDRFVAAVTGKEFGSIKTSIKGARGVIKSIERVADDAVYCIDTSTHSFVVDGLVTHNCMSVDQDPSDFASGDFHIVLHDEPPSLAIWRENEARTMRVDGRLILAMTWPDDPAINVDWLYNEVYEPGRTKSDPKIDWFELWTTENPNLKQEAVAEQAGKWSDEIAKVRIFGQPIRFSNRIHPEFTQNTKSWCFHCQKPIIRVPLEGKKDTGCPHCNGEEVIDYNHVQEFETSGAWPTVFVLDPHPRKPHMFLWVQISPADDWFVIADGKCDGDCTEVRKTTDQIETDLGLFVAQRLMDPNMGASPSGQKRAVTWQSEFADAGLNCDLAIDSEVGRKRIDTMLKPDPDTRAPRLVFHPRCRDTIYQIERYVWDNYSTKVDKDEKQTPKQKYDDYPTMLKYLANAEPNFRFLRSGAPVFSRHGARRGSY